MAAASGPGTYYGGGAGGVGGGGSSAGRTPQVESNIDNWDSESIGTSASGAAESTRSAPREARPIEASQKAHLVESIRGWIKLENEMKELNRAIRERRNQKKALTSTLVSVMKDHSIDCFDINNGSLMYTRNKVKMPVNKQHLLECLTEVYKNDPEEALKVTQYILSTRKEKIVENIKMKLDT
jgi:hypothetical protein